MSDKLYKATAYLDDQVIAKTDAAVFLEGNYYFPKEDVSLDYFGESSRTYTCPWKGLANYKHLQVDGKVVEDAAWTYQTPSKAAEEIAGHLAFDQSLGIRVVAEV